MKSINQLTANELQTILNEKVVHYNYCVDSDGSIWFGIFPNKKQINWIQFANKKTTGIFDAKIIFSKTGKNLKGKETREILISFFDNLINK
jgi:hypothetical protein